MLLPGRQSKVDAGVILSIAGVFLSIATMLSSTWLSFVPLIFLSLPLGFQSITASKANFKPKFFLIGLISTLLVITFFILLSIPPIYSSWLALFAHLFLISLRSFKLTVIFVVLTFLIVPVLFYMRGYVTVSTYNMVKISDPGELKEIFRSQRSIVLIGHAMADSLARAQLTPNERIAEWEEVVINGTPYWIFAVTPANTIAQNYVSKLILVQVQTGEVQIKRTHMIVGSGLWWTNNIELRTYLSTAQSIGNVYPFIRDGKPYFAACLDRIVNFGLSTVPGDVYVYSESGEVHLIPQFSGDPSIPEDYDWEYLDGYVRSWLYFLADINPVSFTIFPRGFLWIPASQYSQDLLNMTLLIPERSGDTARVYFGTSPANPNSIVSVIIANNSGIYYYDVKGLGIYSPQFIQSVVQSKLPAISGGHLYAKYSQLIYTSGYLWVVPVYARTSVVTLWGVAVVNATDPQEMQIYQYSPSYGTYEEFLRTALSLKLTSRKNLTACKIVAGAISRKLEFVYRGDTYIVLKIGNMTYYATPDIGLDQFTKLLSAEIGSYVKVCVSDERIVQVLEP